MTKRYTCPECNRDIELRIWVSYNKKLFEPEVACDDCGSHPAVCCPVCEELIDVVRNVVPRELEHLDEGEDDD